MEFEVWGWCSYSDDDRSLRSKSGVLQIFSGGGWLVGLVVYVVLIWVWVCDCFDLFQFGYGYVIIPIWVWWCGYFDLFRWVWGEWWMVDGSVVLGLWLGVFVDCDRGFGFCLPWVWVLLTVVETVGCCIWCWWWIDASLSTSFFFFFWR